MLKRIAIDIGIIFGVVLLGFGYLWLKGLPERRQARKEAAELFANLNVQAKELKALGTVDLDPTSLTFAELERQLHQPNLKKAGAHNTTQVGWACAGEQCVVLAIFLTPFGEEIKSDTTPASLMLTGTLFGDSGGISAGGIRLGDSEDHLLELSQRKGLSSAKGPRTTIPWDNNWDVAWSALDKKIGALIFINETLLQENRNAAKGITSTAAK